jgi:hypothetical protein
MFIAILAAQLSLGCRPVTIPPQTVRDDCETVIHSAAFVSCRLGDAALVANIERLVRKKLIEEADFSDPAEADEQGNECGGGGERRTKHVDASCDEPFRIADIVSIACGSSFDTGAHPDSHFFAINLRVTRHRVREIPFRSLFVSDRAYAALWRLVRADLRQQLTTECEASDRDADGGDLVANAEKDYERACLSKAGITITFSHFSYGYCARESVIPYSRLRNILLPPLLPASRQ